jgi:hypothetical protein
VNVTIGRVAGRGTDDLVPALLDDALAHAHEVARVLAVGTGGLDLHAVVVHGSIGFGDYVAGRSDLDILIVGEVPEEGVREVAESIIAVPAAAGIPELECSLSRAMTSPAWNHSGPSGCT